MTENNKASVSENILFQPTFSPTQETFLHNEMWLWARIVYAWTQDAPLYFLRDATLLRISNVKDNK